MKRISFFMLAALFLSCSQDKKGGSEEADKITARIERQIIDFHRGLHSAYTGMPVSTDSLMDELFDRSAYYVTYWGTSEPIDSTKSRLHKALPGIRAYTYRLEHIKMKVMENCAFAFFILRQEYILNGVSMEEYLPTTFVFEFRDSRWRVVHAHRSADIETIEGLMKAAQQYEKEPVGQGVQ